MMNAEKYQNSDKQSESQVIHQIRDLPSNDICADCSSKVSSVVNLLYRTFICDDCANVHVCLLKEQKKTNLMKRVKTIRASSFSDEEVSRMRHISAGNREVNTIYLARYMDSSTSEFDNASLSNDTQMLKLFLWNKYIKKTWFRDKYGNILARTNTITTNEKLAVDCYSSSNLMKDPKKSKYPMQEFLQNSNTKEKK